MTRIVLIEDNREYSDVIELALEEESDLFLSERFATCEIALRHLQVQSNRRPDVILLDLRLPGMSGLEAIPYFKEYSPASKIIILTQHDSEADVLRAIAEGASGYLLKSASLREITDGIRTVTAGGATLDPDVAKFILKNLKSRLPLASPEIKLSQREKEILTLLGDGLVKKQIAHELKISYSTVDTHVSHIYEKLQVHNAPYAIAKAYRLGMLPRD